MRISTSPSGVRRRLRPGTTAILLLVIAILGAACRPAEKDPANRVVTRLADVPAVRLNFRYEADVPAPSVPERNAAEERSPLIQAHFDQQRPYELLDRTFPSPDGRRLVAVYHLPTDAPSEFRLDMYSSEGALVRKITPDSMAVRFPDAITWSPDSGTFAFVAVTRGLAAQASPTPAEVATPSPEPTLGPPVDLSDPEANTSGTPETPGATPPPESSPTVPASPTPAPTAAADNVFTFRTEQLYTAGAEGDGLRSLTQNEGLIYFYFVWSPDSSMLATLAATTREWQYYEFQAEENKMVHVPAGRLRVIEKTGRERRLDDGVTAVKPVWSPDSAKIACAFDKDIRIYDAGGDSPTQAAVPLRNALRISSATYDREQQASLNAADANGANGGGENSNSAAPTNTTPSPVANANANGNAHDPNATPAPNTIPDESTLVSFNPIIVLNWLTDDQLYFQTAFVKRMKIEADSAMSFARWHRLILTPQPAAIQPNDRRVP